MTIEPGMLAMDTLSKGINRHRRYFVGAAAATVAATQLDPGLFSALYMTRSESIASTPPTAMR